MERYTHLCWCRIAFLGILLEKHLTGAMSAASVIMHAQMYLYVWNNQVVVVFSNVGSLKKVERIHRENKVRPNNLLRYVIGRVRVRVCRLSEDRLGLHDFAATLGGRCSAHIMTVQ
jgi:hypothetical protein